MLEFNEKQLNHMMDIINSSSVSCKCVPTHKHTHTHLQQNHKTEHSEETFSKAKQVI